MIRVHELTPQGQRALVQWLGGSTDLELGPEHVLATDHVLSIATSGIRRFDEDLRARFEMGDPSLDRLLAPWLHRQLPLGRALGSRPGVWRWLGASPLRPLLAWRWPRTPERARRGRYAGSLTEHGLARLWWAAELTCDLEADVPYADTLRLVQGQYLLHRPLSSRLSRSRPVLLGVLDVVGGRTDALDVLNPVIRALGALSSALSLDALHRSEVASLVRDLVADTQQASAPEHEPD